MQTETEDLIAQGDMVACRYAWRGTNTGRAGFEAGHAADPRCGVTARGFTMCCALQGRIVEAGTWTTG